MVNVIHFGTNRFLANDSYVLPIVITGTFALGRTVYPQCMYIGLCYRQTNRWQTDAILYVA